jgi:hypothetical protein
LDAVISLQQRGGKKHPPKHLRKLRPPGAEIARQIAILRAGINLRIK